ncbi:MAG: alpha/beta hydrolase [Planctomycetota bacterium]
MYKLSANGHTITYHDSDPSGNGSSGKLPTLLLLHGFPLHSAVWNDVAERMTGKARVIRPNLRGFGTFTNDADFGMHELAADVRALVLTLDLPPLIIAGLSMGGYVALDYVRNWQEGVIGLGLVNTRSGADAPEAKPARDEMAATAKRRGTPTVVSAMHPRMLAPEAYEQRPAVSEALLRIMLDTPATTIARASRAMRDRDDYSQDLRSFDGPISIVAGEEDQIVPLAESRAMADAVSSARLDVLPHCGHMSPVESPAEVAVALSRLVDDSQKSTLLN